MIIRPFIVNSSKKGVSTAEVFNLLPFPLDVLFFNFNVKSLVFRDTKISHLNKKGFLFKT